MPARPTIFSSEQGFTLVEMLVALSLFAAIAAMGVAMLRSSVDTQASVQNRLSGMSGLNRMRAVMGQDLAQALVRPSRDEQGAQRAAFMGQAESMEFVSAGADGLEGRTRPDAVRLRYVLDGGAWQRAQALHVDGAPYADADAVAQDVEMVRLRYRDEAGAWHEAWPQMGGPDLPRAVEMTLKKRGSAPLTLMFLLGPNGPPAPMMWEQAP